MTPKQKINRQYGKAVQLAEKNASRRKKAAGDLGTWEMPHGREEVTNAHTFESMKAQYAQAMKILAAPVFYSLGGVFFGIAVSAYMLRAVVPTWKMQVAGGLAMSAYNWFLAYRHGKKNA